MEAALSLIGEKGLAALTMREIATASGMPLASVYQYFPNKSAVIETLYKSFSDETRAQLSQVLENIEAVDDILPVACEIIDRYHARLVEKPAIQDVLNAVQADKALQSMDVEETREQARQFVAATQGFVDEEGRSAYARAVHLLFQLAGSTIRLEMMIGADDDQSIVEDYKNLIRAQLAPFGG